MNIRNKILIYFSVLSISLIGISFILIYILFSNYRTEEFQQRIKDKTATTLKFLVEVKQIDHNLLQTMDEHTINSLYREKVLIFNSHKKLIYSSIDDTKIKFPGEILNKLDSENPVVEFEEEGFDVVGIFFEFEGNKYFGISKAYDKFGLSKLTYLRYVLILIFLLISTAILISSFILSNQISNPIIKMMSEIKNVNFDSDITSISIPSSKDEIYLLASRFNQLMQRLKDAYSFQKHAVHHISHELKTPIAVLVSNFEKLEKEGNQEKLRAGLLLQKEDTKSLGDIINALLEISKVESGVRFEVSRIRIDDLIFEEVDNIKNLHENFNIEIDIHESVENEEGLTVTGNTKLIKLSIVNLITNCIRYSNNNKSLIRLSNEENRIIIDFVNSGNVISEKEKPFLFQHFFRGSNSKGKRGFGLGLVLISKIALLHKGSISYENPDSSTNVFRLILPLR